MATEPDDLNEEIDPPQIEEQNEALTGDEEADVTLPGEEPAEGEAGEGESSVIRDMRAAMREKDRLIREQEAKLSAASRPNAPQDPGPKPTLAQFDYDEEKHEAALDGWYKAKAVVDQAAEQATQQATQIERQRLENYTATKSTQRIAGIDDAEKRVFAQVDDMTRNAILHAKSPAVVAALDKYPNRLAEISELMKTDVAEGLMQLGELRAKAQVMPRRRNAEPEEIANGSASFSQTSKDKALEKLEKEADRTGDRSKLRAYRKANGIKVGALN